MEFLTVPELEGKKKALYWAAGVSWACGAALVMTFSYMIAWRWTKEAAGWGIFGFTMAWWAQMLWGWAKEHLSEAGKVADYIRKREDGE
jgi:phosphotransferase system  glucose/maltose/N-acetylglucosamine-specific IIC component